MSLNHVWRVFPLDACTVPLFELIGGFHAVSKANPSQHSSGYSVGIAVEIMF